jgi:ornithine cyclodeaminase/alanine dehydrogenase-like protein (mu-crystallin family)
VNGAETVRMLVTNGQSPLVWDLDRARRELVAERLGARAADSFEHALSCETVITVTPGHAVLFAPGSLREGQHVSLMGADGPGKAEVAVEELGRARLFCDDWEQASHGGELAAGVAAGVVSPERVTSLGAVLAGDAEGRGSAGEVTLFDSTGLAIQDLAIAIAAMTRARELELPTITL